MWQTYYGQLSPTEIQELMLKAYTRRKHDLSYAWNSRKPFILERNPLVEVFKEILSQ